MFRFLYGWLIPLFLLYFILAELWNAATGSAPVGDVLLGALTMSLVVAAIVGYRIFRLRRAYKKSVFAKHEPGIALAFNDEYFVSGLPGRSEGRFLWSALYDFAENDRIALIYTSKRRFVVVPKHAMPSDSWDTLRALVPRRSR